MLLRRQNLPILSESNLPGHSGHTFPGYDPDARVPVADSMGTLVELAMTER
jgi:hypothetical protein